MSNDEIKDLVYRRDKLADIYCFLKGYLEARNNESYIDDAMLSALNLQIHLIRENIRRLEIEQEGNNNS